MFLTPLLSALLFSPARAEAPPTGPDFTLGYYTPYGVQPGVRLASRHRRGDGGRLFISPSASIFTRPWNHLSGMLNADIGLWRDRDGRLTHTAWSIGSGYLAAAQVTSESIDLASGEATAERELRHYYLPTVNYELGWGQRSRQSWFGKLSYGRKVSPSVEDSDFFAVELGARFGGRR